MRTNRIHNFIVGSLAAFLTALMLFSSCVCTPTVDLPVKVEAPVNVAASMPVDVDLRAEIAALRTEIGPRAGGDIIAENANWIIAFAIGWPMLCVLAGFVVYMVSNRIPLLRAAKDRVKGCHRLALVSQWPKTGILDAVKPKRTPPDALPVVAECPKCATRFSPRLPPSDGADELDG